MRLAGPTAALALLVGLAAGAHEPTGQAPVADLPTPLHHDVPPIVVATAEFIVPPPKPKPRSVKRRAERAQGHGVEQWRPLVASMPDWPVDRMLAILACESKGNPAAVNDSSGAAGLFQLHPPPPGALDPATNVRIAHAKWRRAGLAPWRGCL